VKFVAVAAAALLLSGCGGGDSIVGAGSSFVYPLVAKWIQDYSARSGVEITYGPIGSGGGITQLTNRTIDFGASDAPLSPADRERCDGCLQIPWAVAGTSIAYNVPGAPRHLRLTGAVLADIFLGKLTSWNDSRLAKLNPNAKLPALRVTPIYRTDASGTTYNLSDYLARISPDWKRRVGVGVELEFPAGTGGHGSSGVAAALARADGGITYVDAAYSLRNGFSYAAMRNRAGNFVLPDRSAVAAAAASATTTSIVDPPATAPDAYPLSSYTYALIPARTGKAGLLRRFLLYALGPGQRFGPPLQFAQLPPRIVAADKQTIAKITTG